MRKVRYSFSGVLSAVLLLVSFSSAAQVVDISSCRAIEDRLERFDCFESLGATDTSATAPAPSAAPAAPVAAPASSAAPAAAAGAPRTNLPVLRLPARSAPATESAQEQVAAPATAPQAEAGSDVDNFGLNSESGARVVQDEDGKAELTDMVTAVEQVGPSLALITLQSGQQWRQSISKRYLVEAGDEVRIYPSMWGNAYRLSVKRLGGFIQVERVK